MARYRFEHVLASKWHIKLKHFCDDVLAHKRWEEGEAWVTKGAVSLISIREEANA